MTDLAASRQWIVKYQTPVGPQHVVLVGEDIWSRNLSPPIYKYEVPIPLRAAPVDGIILWAEAKHKGEVNG